VGLDTENEILLSTIEDESEMPYKIKVTLAEGGPLPDFIKFDD